MFNARSLALPLAVASSMVLLGCKQPALADAESAPPSSDASQEEAEDKPVAKLVPEPKQELYKVKIKASVSGIADMMESFKRITESVTPDDPSDPMSALQAQLLAMGFGPGFLSNVALDETHLLSMAVAPEGGSEDLDLAASLAVIDSRRLIDGMPSSLRPQPLGEGLWELRTPEANFLLKESGKELQLGLASEDLEKASTLRGSIDADMRVFVHVDEIDAERFGLSEALDLDEFPPFGPQLKSVIDDLTQLELKVDLGTERDAQLVGSARAPFHKLGLDPLGAPRAAATALESRLPGGAFFVTTMSWGDPKLVHETIKRSVPVEQIPQPFGDIVKSALEGVHGMLDELGSDIAVAFYVDKAGRATMLVAADIKDEAKTTAAIRKIDETLVTTVETHAALQGKNDDAKFKITYKPGGMSLGAVKADQINLKIAKSFESDFEPAALFLNKGSIDVVSFTQNKTAVVAVGAGAKLMAKDISRQLGKTRSASLAQDEGLQAVRKSMGGCQVCMSFDVTDYLRFRLLMLAGEAKRERDRALGKRVKQKLATVGKLKGLGEPGLGFRVGEDEAVGAFNVPQTLVFADPKTMASLLDANDFVDNPSEALEAASKPKSTKSK